MAVEAARESQDRDNILVNCVVKNLSVLAGRAWEKRGIVTFAAPTGIGKSTAIAYADRNLRFEHRVLRCRAVTTRCEILQALALEPGEKWSTHGRNWMRSSDLYNRIVDRVRERSYLLIVDEADRLRADCFEMLRDFWDEARLPILLVGNEDLTGKLNRQHERLSRRIFIRFVQRALRQAELREALEFMRHEVTDEEFSLLWTRVGGSPGFAEIVLKNADAIAEQRGVKRGAEQIEGALRYFPTLARKAS